MLGPLSYAVDEGYQKTFSDKTNRIIDKEVRFIIDKAHKKCFELLTDKKALIQK